MITGCTSCYNPYSSSTSVSGPLKEFIVQNILGQYYRIYLCHGCEETLYDIEKNASLNEGLNFLQQSINNSTLFAKIGFNPN